MNSVFVRWCIVKTPFLLVLARFVDRASPRVGEEFLWH